MIDSKIVIASKNENKVCEINQILNQASISVLSLNSFPDIDDVEENGSTFLENATLKAEYYHQSLNQPVISDDSGLVVPALNGEPGIFSARYAGEHANYKKNNEKLLLEMAKFSGNDRLAYFICVAVYKDKNRTLSAEGRVYGEIAFTPRGSNGFGYDPLFFHPGSNMTFAELGSEEKNKISHRYLAFIDLKGQLEAVLG